jgi:hypothetical protein
MLRTSPSARQDRPAKLPSRRITWRQAIILLLAGAAAGGAYLCYQAGASPVAERLRPSVFPAPGQATLPGLSQLSGTAPLPSPVATATAAVRAPRAWPQATRAPHPTVSPPTRIIIRSAPAPRVPLAGRGHAGALLLSDTGSRLTSWNQTAALCQKLPFQVTDGRVGTDSSGDATLTVNGPGSCAALVSPDTYSSAVIEAEIDLPALPGRPGTIANWTVLRLTDDRAWPEDGELDAVEAEPVDGVNAVSWHSGTSAARFVASTDGFFPARLPVRAANLAPGWHTVDVVYTRGFFAVYYDGREYTSYTAGVVTGDPLNVYLTTTVTPDVSAAQQQIGGPPVNSDSSPAAFAVKYLRIWSYR